MTLGNKLCGHIVAVRQDIPWAYMMAIQPIFDDIKLRLNIDEVRLPTIDEVQLAASYLGKVEKFDSYHLQDSSQTAPTSKSAGTKLGGWPAVSSKPSQICLEMALETEIDCFIPMKLPNSHSRTELQDIIPSSQELPWSLLNRDTHPVDLREDRITNKKSAIPNEMSVTSTNRTLVPTLMSQDHVRESRDRSHSHESANPYRQEVKLRQNPTKPSSSLSVPLSSGVSRSKPVLINSLYQSGKVRGRGKSPPPEHYP